MQELFSNITEIITSILSLLGSCCNELLNNELFIITIGIIILGVIISLIYNIIKQIKYNNWVKKVSGKSYIQQAKENRYARTHSFEEWNKKYGKKI